MARIDLWQDRFVWNSPARFIMSQHVAIGARTSIRQTATDDCFSPSKPPKQYVVCRPLLDGMAAGLVPAAIFRL
jgi:hypothetical protein